MATLGSIIARVENELMYSPDLRAYRLDIRQVVNSRYGLLARLRRWPWLQRRAPLWVFPDLVLANNALTFPGVASLGARCISIADSQFATYSDRIGDFTGQVRRLIAGAEFGVTDREALTMGGATNWEDGPFVVEWATTHAGQVPARTLLYLDPRLSISALSAADGTYTLRFNRYLLPPDVDELERIVDDQGVPLGPLSPGRERDFALDASRDAGTKPRWFLEDVGHRPTFGPFVYPGQSDATTPNPDQTGDIYQRENLPIRISISIAEIAGTGSWVVGTRIRAFICWWYAGRFGPPSPEVEFTTTDTTKVLQFGGWFSATDRPLLLPSGAAAAPGAYGRRVALFVSENDTAFYFRGFADPGTTVLADQTLTLNHPLDTGSYVPAGTIRTLRVGGNVQQERHDRVYPGGPYRYVRLYPRTGTVHRCEVDYHARPAQLIELTDVPEFPEQYSEVLVWATCLGMAERYHREVGRSLDVGVWERNYREWLGRLEQRDMPQMRSRMVRGAHGAEAPGGPWLDPSRMRYTE